MWKALSWVQVCTCALFDCWFQTWEAEKTSRILEGMIYRKAVTERMIYSALILSVLGCCAVQTAHYTKISQCCLGVHSWRGKWDCDYSSAKVQYHWQGKVQIKWVVTTNMHGHIWCFSRKSDYDLKIWAPTGLFLFLVDMRQISSKYFSTN